MNRSSTFAAALLFIAASSAASAAVVKPGTYILGNHPDGDAASPFYGLRLDELYDVTGGHDIFTFDFDAKGSAVYMDYDGASVIHIYGKAFGGRDTGSSYASDKYRGIYDIDFTYNKGVAKVPGDGDIWVDTYNHANKGTIITPLGDTVRLVDERGDKYSFRFGDENDEKGHRGYKGFSGWGWLANKEGSRCDTMEFLFTAQSVPGSGAGVLGLLGMAVAARRTRR